MVNVIKRLYIALFIRKKMLSLFFILLKLSKKYIFALWISNCQTENAELCKLQCNMASYPVLKAENIPLP